jgi:hypothetical protein
MKVDSSIYSRYPLDIGTNQSKNNVEKNGKAQGQNQANEVKQSDTYERIAAKVNEIAATKKAESPMPANLQDVLTREETQMLQSLFADFDTRWGVDAYKINEAQINVGARGNQIDLIS